MFEAFSTGFAISIGLILAIGAQNAFVLKQGLRGEHVLAIVLTCAISDAVAMAIGVNFFRIIVAQLPLVEPIMRWGGALFLLVYGARSLMAAWQGQEGLSPTEAPPKPLMTTLLTCLAFTWLNPHFYLDTMVLIGTISTRFPGREMVFASGAAAASFVFFFSLGFGARALRPVLSTPRAWRILDAGIGIVMLGISIRLIVG